jgi:hypothetical protein
MSGKLQAVAVVSAGLIAAGVAAASAQAGVGARYAFGLGTSAVSSPAGMTIVVEYRDPQNPDAKPPPLESLVLTMPRGLRFDTSAAPQCHATDAELRTKGRAACPEGSRVGAGTLTAVTGFPGMGPTDTDVTVFNGGDELIELVTFKGTEIAAGSDRLSIAPGRLSAHPAPVPGGPPDGRTTVKRIAIAIHRRVSGGRAFITTPSTCPTAAVWTSLATIRYEGYGDAARLTASTPCTLRPAGIRVQVVPRVVEAGETTRFRFQITSKRRECLGGVAVRVAGRRLVTDATGLARRRIRFERAGERAVSVGKPGCGSAHAAVRVMEE